MQRRLMQHRRTKWVWIDGFLSGVWKWECFRTVKMSADREFQVDGAATEKARRASSVCMRGTTSIGASEERRARGGACVCATWVCTTLCISKKFIMSIFVPPPYQTGTRKNNVLNDVRSSVTKFVIATVWKRMNRLMPVVYRASAWINFQSHKLKGQLDQGHTRPNLDLEEASQRHHSRLLELNI